MGGSCTALQLLWLYEIAVAVPSLAVGIPIGDGLGAGEFGLRFMSNLCWAAEKVVLTVKFLLHRQGDQG